MRQNLSDFIAEWNKAHKRFTFSLQESPAVNRPTSVEVRYPAARYPDFFSSEIWEKFCDLVERRSRGTMYVATSERLFARGIVEIKIASQNHNFREHLVIDVLKWIGEKVFPKD